MCSRYEMKAGPQALKSRFRTQGAGADMARAEVRPTDPAPIVVGPAAARQLRPARFGLTVSWDNKPLINARVETLLQKPTFRAMVGNRCLVPATAYFEWRRDGGHRHRNRVTCLGNVALMGFAGLYNDNGFVIVTCAPAPAVAHIHDRMPVILTPEAEESWLDPTAAPEKVLGLLQPFAGVEAFEDAPRQGALF